MTEGCLIFSWGDFSWGVVWGAFGMMALNWCISKIPERGEMPWGDF